MKTHPTKCHSACEHCAVCDAYRAERTRQEIAWENGGFRDDPSMKKLVTFKQWLQGKPYSPKF